MTTEMATLREWTISGMDCGSCVGKVRGAVERLPGVSDVEVTLMRERLRLNLDETLTSRERVETAVRSLGFGIAVEGAPRERKGFVLPGATADDQHLGHENASTSQPAKAVTGSKRAGTGWYHSPKGRLVIVTGLLLAAAWTVKLLASAQVAQWAFVLACLIGVTPIVRRAFAALRAGMPFTIEMLMTIAAVGALFINAAEEAALVVFLFAVGEVLEGVAADRARSGIRALSKLIPKTALVDEAGVTREVAADNLLVGQMVLVRPGDRIPADGTIAEGRSGVDDSPVTGESVPVTKGPGDTVFAGAINTEAALRVRVTRTAEDNTIARIIRLVEEAESARAPTERFIDRFSRIYMPAVVGAALLVAIVPPLAFAQDWGTWVYRALALLLIGCPCALVISVPASLASALSSGARRGLLMKGGAVIEATARIRQVAFDKTGTLTHGRPLVTDIFALGATTEAELLAVAAGVEAGSSHPIAVAIQKRAQDAGIVALPRRDARALVGKGAEAVVNGRKAWVASPVFATEAGVLDSADLAVATRLEEEGKTCVVAFRENEPLGLIAVRDEPRIDAVDAVRQLASLGVVPIMLTGDNERTAAAIAGRLGLEFRSGMLPEDKLAAIRAMTAGGGVMMIGDGINDAPALKQASVGVAMGSGTDVALETADAAILRDKVTDVAAILRLSRAAMGNIRQNIAIALGLKGVFLVTTIIGVTGLWIAVLADTGATVLVTLNALRLLAFDPEREG